ncbi:hypothetical protein CHLNCDRAFT_58610 [Chlorella variabilis]|uniref:ABC transporter domain-containing protein n=1 Tax=Chlorella variabilis TaxID=554065 RepID=E1ZLU8_CHLVA|nr:hypothetical protein CHLNCDRAFT_58610 [Chlorella variabilis]EFN53324.1 hypothetical protein CHLNCDRAFT_58610 [Chlorella variabilis]|eukprot:XP_005845426.1 hypothetical protein CHLNCDRAFT_58610 [Chlorella variabilis]
MNGLYTPIAGDLTVASDPFRGASTTLQEHRNEELHDLQEAALTRNAKPKPSVVTEGPFGPDGAASWRRLVRRKSMREALVLEISRQAKEEEDQVMSLMIRVRQRFDQAGVPMQDVQIRFRNLSVVGMAAVKHPTRSAKGLLQLRHALSGIPTRGMREVRVLDGISSVLKPGRLTLLLGPPGSGKTSLMKALSGQLKRDKGRKVVADELTYNGLSFGEFVVERSAAYINQNDIHFGELTVTETLRFAALCQSSRTRVPAEKLLEEKEQELGIIPDPAVDTYMRAMGQGYRLAADIAVKALGLEGCANTLVGNSMIRGISGGQRKRVTSGEMLVGPSKVLFADEISTGLDSATTFEICNRLRALCHIVRSTILVSLLQPTPETYGCFDDVMLLSGGILVFHGPRELILPFFESQSFKCPDDKGAADFLQEVTTGGEQRMYWAGKGEYKYVSDAELADAYRATETGQAFAEELKLSPEEEVQGHGELAVHTYGQDQWTLFKACLGRQTKLFMRNRAFIAIRMLGCVPAMGAKFPLPVRNLAGGQCIIMGVAVGTLFLQQGRDTLADAQASMYLSVSFFSIMTQFMVSFAAPGLLIERLPTYYKHRDAHFHPAWCFALPEILLQMPLIATEATIWTAMIYFMVGFVVSVRLLVFWGIMFVAGVCGLSLFFLLAVFAKTITVAAALQNLCILIFTISSGFIVNFDDLNGPWKGVWYANPVAYFLQALAVNELECENWDTPARGDSGLTQGQLFLEQRGYFLGYHWVWLGLIVWGIGSTLLNTSLFMTVSSFLTTGGRKQVAFNRANEDASSATGGKEVEKDAAEHAIAAAGDAEEGGVAPSGGGGKSALPFTPVRMTFQDLKYSVPLPSVRPGALEARLEFPRHVLSQPQCWLQGYESIGADDDSSDPHAGRLLLLRGISGSFRPGVLTALMGSSGAGKSTLMDCLGLRKTGGKITGDIRVNGFPQQPATFNRVMGYAEQFDIHVAEATVREALMFSARLRLPKSVPTTAAEAFVEEMMDVVELGRQRDAIVGLPGVNGLSVEKRKRLTIAVELVANPSIVFMDEPTSGLDARAAAIIMRAVRRITSTGRCVVCTIHQPSWDVFKAFDELLLLKRGGSTIFAGELGTGASNLVSYLQQFKAVTPITAGYNPATWMLEVTSAQVEAESDLNFADCYAMSKLAEANDRAVASLQRSNNGLKLDVKTGKLSLWRLFPTFTFTFTLREPREDETDLRLQDLAAASVLVQTRELLLRDFRQYNRLLNYVGTRMGITLIIAVFFGTVLAGQGDNAYTYNGILNIMGMQYSSVMFIGILNAMMVQSIISVRRTVFYRERAGGTYQVLPFSAAEFLVEVPYLAVQAVLYSCVLYWLVGFQAEAGKFFWFLLILFLTLLVWTFFGIHNVQITPSLAIANAFTSFMYGVWDLFCGFYKPQSLIPKGWIWMYWLDPISYTLYGLVVGELGDNEDLMADQSPPITRQASKRPGQAPPINHPGQRSRRHAEAGPNTSSSSGWWSERQQRRHDAWDDRREADEQMMLATTPQRAALQAGQRAAEIQQVQARLDSTEPLRCWPTAGRHDGTPCCFRKTGTMPAVYHGLGGVAGSLVVPIFECALHGEKNVTAHPFQVGCVPSSPVINTVYLSEDLVEMFRLLQLKDGVGGHGFVEVHNLMANRLDPQYGHQPATNTWLQLNDEMLQEAAHNVGVWRSYVAEFVRCAQLLDTSDPFGDCFICASTFRAALNDGTLIGLYRLAVMLDACLKPCHFAMAGRSQPHCPSIYTFLAAVARGVISDFESGKLNSEAQQRWAEHCAASEASGACSSNLTCSRPSASARGVVDVSGLAGVFCNHCVAGRDAMLAMRTPEQWEYHIRTFTSVLLRRPDIADAYIDIGCRLKTSLLAALQRHVDAGDLAPGVLEKLNVMVPWMHAFDHDVPCQLQFSGLYQV